MKIKSEEKRIKERYFELLEKAKPKISEHLKDVWYEESQRLYEKETCDVTGEFEVETLEIKDAVVTANPVSSLRFSNVTLMKVFGEHEVEFPREGIRLEQRAVESYCVEKLLERYPQFLRIRGRLQPHYGLKDVVLDTTQGLKATNARLEQSVLDILEPTRVRIWAEYTSQEEKLLNATKQALISVNEFRKSLSPSVGLVFADGTSDVDTGSQVMEYRGRVFPSNSVKARIETQHASDPQRIPLSSPFAVEGYFLTEGTGRWTLPSKTVRAYGGAFRGSLQYNRGHAKLIGTLVQ